MELDRNKKILLYLAVFLAAFYIPFDSSLLQKAILEAFHMLGEYAREHVLTCLIPAFFIAGAIANFVSKEAVIKYFGGGVRKWISYGIASVSGMVLAVCSCTVLPLFSGIYKRGAGIGPAIAFLYSGPAINVLAILLTARVLGWQLGLARAIGAIFFALVIGLAMALIFRKEDRERLRGNLINTSQEGQERRSGPQNLVYFGIMILILISLTWSKEQGALLYNLKWPITATLLAGLSYILHKWFNKDELKEWMDSTWDFAEGILPLLLVGVMVAGLLMGRPDTNAGLIPAGWVSASVGGNSLLANFTASIIGAFMYFATLTEIPILQGLLGLGMGRGPALALLLAGPAVSLPNLLVVHSVLGTKKTLTYVVLVVLLSTFVGTIYGWLIV